MLSCKSSIVQNQLPVVSVSILPQKYFIEKLAGDRVQVNVLIPPGASPAAYEPTLSQLSRLDQSSVYMKMGYLGFELSWMDKIKSVNPGIKIIDLSRGIELIPDHEDEEPENPDGHSHHGYDPHIWMSAINAKIIVRNIYNELVLMFPGEEALFSQRLTNLYKELDSLHQYISESLMDIQQKSFFIYHPALTYFARDYQFIQHSLELGGKAPSPAHLKRLTDLGREKHIATIFVQSQFDQRNAEILAEEIKAEIVPFNPLDEEWEAQMLHIAEQLKKQL